MEESQAFVDHRLLEALVVAVQIRIGLVQADVIEVQPLRREVGTQLRRVGMIDQSLHLPLQDGRIG